MELKTETKPRPLYRGDQFYRDRLCRGVGSEGTEVWVSNGFRTKCVAAGESTNTYYGILKSSHGYFPSIVIGFGSMCNAARRLFPTKLINVRSSNHPKEKGENFPTGLSFMEKQFE